MFDSLKNNSSEFKLYVLALDEICYKIITNINDYRLRPIYYSDFEDDELKTAKSNRSHAEYCWTCSSALILYVLEKYNEKVCTYIDSDLYFYSDPKVLVDEMGKHDVQIIEHRFKNTIYGRKAEKISGKYCVQFNTFKNTDKGRYLLNLWKDNCISECRFIDKQNDFLGDQGYLESWGEHDFVHVLQNLGGGVAPWNVEQYTVEEHRDNFYKLIEKSSKKEFNLIFYHFHNIAYISTNKADINVFKNSWRLDNNFILDLYRNYLISLNEKKCFLRDNYGLFPIIKHHPGLPKEDISFTDCIQKLKQLSLVKVYIIFRKIIIYIKHGRKDIVIF